MWRILIGTVESDGNPGRRDASRYRPVRRRAGARSRSGRCRHGPRPGSLGPKGMTIRHSAAALTSARSGGGYRYEHRRARYPDCAGRAR